MKRYRAYIELLSGQRFFWGEDFQGGNWLSFSPKLGENQKLADCFSCSKTDCFCTELARERVCCFGSDIRTRVSFFHYLWFQYKSVFLCL